MAKGAYLGINNVARKIKKIYIGINGVARKVKKVYIGINGVARLCWSSGTYQTLIASSDRNVYSSNAETPTTFSPLGSAMSNYFYWVIYDKPLKCFIGIIYTTSSYGASGTFYTMPENGTTWTSVGTVFGFYPSVKPSIDPTDGGIIYLQNNYGTYYYCKATISNGTITTQQCLQASAEQTANPRLEKIGDYYVYCRFFVPTTASSKYRTYCYVNYSPTINGTYTLKSLYYDTSSWSTAVVSSVYPRYCESPLHYVDNQYVVSWVTATWDNNSGRLNFTSVIIMSGATIDSMTGTAYYGSCGYPNNYMMFAFNKGIFNVNTIESTMSSVTQMTPVGLWALDFSSSSFGALTRLCDIPWGNYSIQDYVFANNTLMVTLSQTGHYAYTKNLTTWTMINNAISGSSTSITAIDN